MDCEQFENRVQLLLDSRASLTLDLAIQKHARSCEPCQSELAVYECFSDFGSETAAFIEQDGKVVLDDAITLDARESRSKPWQNQQRAQVRNRFVLAVAALVFLSSFLVSQQADSPAPAAKNDIPTIETVPDHQTDLSNSKLFFSESWDQLGGIWDSVVPDDLSQISPGNYIDISSLGQIDLVSLMPEQQMRVVRNLPATFETMEPIYRYSIDLPVLQNWSNGINCTLGLIQTSLPTSTRHKLPALPSGKDLGIRRLQDNRNLC